MANTLDNVFDSIDNELNLMIDDIGTGKEDDGKYGWINDLTKMRGRGSIVNQASKNTFNFPVFISSNISLDYATAATSLLEQVYVSFLQTAISAQPYVSEDTFKLGNTFEKFKSNTDKYLEYVRTDIQKLAAHATYETDECVYEYEVVNIDDDLGKDINKELDKEPLSEFGHFFEAASNGNSGSGNSGNNKERDTWNKAAEIFKDANLGTGSIKDLVDAVSTGRKLMGLDPDTAAKIDKTQLEIEKLKREKDNYDRDESDKRKKIELEIEKLENDLSDQLDKIARDISKNRKDMMAKAPELLDESKIAKLNTMKPYMMKVQIIVNNKDHTQTPVEQLIGVKCNSRLIDAKDLPDVVAYPLQEMNKITRKAKWKAGEIKFFKDFVFKTKEKKQTAFDKMKASKNWYRRLYDLAHSQGDAFASRITSGSSGLIDIVTKHNEYGIIPNATIIMSNNDVNNIKKMTDIDMLNGKVAAKFCNELFLIGLMVIDSDAESIKLLLPDQSKEFEVHSIASLNKQLAQLDTAGAKTREMFKILG